MTQYRRPPIVETILAEGRPVVLFGAGDLGVLSHYALTDMGVEIACFADGRHSKQGQVLSGLEIWSPEQLGDLPQNTHVFLCGNYLATMAARLREIGFTRIHDCVELLDGFDFTGADVGFVPSQIERKIAFHKREVHKAREQAEDTLVFKYLDVVVTEACSMKCIDCSNLMQYYTKPKHSDLDLLASAVDRIMESVDGLYEFRVLGGEPFVNPRVHRVINQLTAYAGVEKVVIYTNGTIVPRGENLECLKNEKVVVEITNYGSHSKKHDELMATLAENGIPHVSKIPVWTDSGRIKFVERSASELDDMFHNCSVNDILTLLNGKLYRCPFSANGTNLGAIPETSADVVDLTGDLKGPELREQLRGLYNRSGHLTACGFCNGRDYRTPRVEAAIQTRRPLPLTVV
ncbi:4Fe-4S cluster-binding domain-containing protein [Streptomyces triticagri]|uniref:4Fe-4S cluster-binding domain-containing protein n=1 Tax=Streptomyces triticagri TaxID=2293568 RepID=A0A372M701_9ACTN|nr:4Fe-4S cluster-binding domain-containing protein [Streptomyces triticagri]RFU86631.1 4Fe-4S cluster-binding domain-containing protein [Streptomyces triticagri]